MSEKMKEVFPFVSLVWNGRKIRDKWKPIYETLKKHMHKAELELIHRGVRQADVVGFTPRNFDHQLNEIIEMGLVPLTIHRTQPHAGYDHMFYFAEKMELDTYVYSVAADTLENAQRFRDMHLLETGTDHRGVGGMLGYEEDCMDFFLPIWLEKKAADPMYEIAENTPGSEVIGPNEINVIGHPYLNRFAKYIGMQLCTYFTCSYVCPGAIKFSEELYDILHGWIPEETEALVELLSMPITWSMQNMITEFRHPLFRGATNGYIWPTRRVVHWRSE